MKDGFTSLQVVKNWLKLIVLVGIAPWAYFYVTSIAPIVHHALGIENPRYATFLLPILLPPFLLFHALLDKHDFTTEEELKIKRKGQTPVAVECNDWGIHITHDRVPYEKMPWDAIKSIEIRIEGQPFPMPHWYIGNAKDTIMVPNDARGAETLFFKAFPAHLAQYANDRTYETVIAACSAIQGVFQVWNAPENTNQ